MEKNEIEREKENKICGIDPSGSTGEMSDPNYATINLELDDQVKTWYSIRTSWDVSNKVFYEATSNRDREIGKDAYCKIDLSHTHSLSGSTGGMSGDDYATINLELDDQVNTWYSIRTSWDVSNKVFYDADSSRDRKIGKDAYCKIDLSHTHTLSPVALVE